MNKKESGVTLVEFIIVIGIVALIFTLVYLPYRSGYQSFHRSNVEVNLQQNAHIVMKKIVKELGAGMIVIPEDSDDGKDGTIDYRYAKSNSDKNDPNPYKIAIISILNSPDPKSGGDRIAIYAALPDDSDTTVDDESKKPIDPVNHTYPPTVDYDLPDTPLLYLRRYDKSSSSWKAPEPLIRKDENLKVTQLNFIVGGDNESKVLVTLELAQKEPVSQRWYTYKLISGVKLGAR